MPKLSVTIITKNEADHIGAALRSVAWADERVVIDSGSTDDTVAIARQYTDRVSVREWTGYVAQKNHAASIASHDWILSLDADERVTPELAGEIQRLLTSSETTSQGSSQTSGQTSGRASNPEHAGYLVPRVAWYLGRWIRSTDWYPDYQLRLYDRRVGQWTGRYVHESVSVRGSTDRLRGELQHFPYRDIADHLETIDRYTTYAARQLHDGGRRSGPLQVALHPPLAFLRNYLLRGGIRDGMPGLIISGLNAYYVLLKLAKLWELAIVSEFTRPPESTLRAATEEHPVPGRRPS